jgi:hypothetical protein
MSAVTDDLEALHKVRTWLCGRRSDGSPTQPNGLDAALCMEVPLIARRLADHSRRLGADYAPLLPLLSGSWTPEYLCDSELRKAEQRLRYLDSLPEAKPDGPADEPPGMFYWAGEPLIIGKKSWELCRAIWQRPGVDFATIGKEVWGDDCTKTTTIKSALSRLNTKMTDQGVRFQWIASSERVYLDGESPAGS